MSEPQDKQTTQQQAARRIAAILAQAESEAKLGNLAARDHALAKAAALQHKYAVDQIMLEQQGKSVAEEITYADFCAESNTPLIKAKRQLVIGLADLYRGHVMLCSKWDPIKRKLDKRAYLRVHAHESDLSWVTQLYTSLILQMQTEMAKDERRLAPAKGVAGWRVSYAHAWVTTVVDRLWVLQCTQDRTITPGSALALVDKRDKVKAYVEDTHTLSKGRRMPVSDKDDSGRAAGREAGWRADLGQQRVAEPNHKAVDE